MTTRITHVQQRRFIILQQHPEYPLQMVFCGMRINEDDAKARAMELVNLDPHLLVNIMTVTDTRIYNAI